MKIALCLIVEGTDKEAELLDRCLSNVEYYVDGIFVTSTYQPGEEPNKEVERVCNEHVVNYSTFEWCNNFSKARNYNFSRVPKKFDYIMWCDADDLFRGLENMRPILEEHKDTDVFVLNYLYHFNEWKQPDVVHMKTQIVKNDGCVKWAGKLHEDFTEQRQLKSFFIKDIERLHLTNDERVDRNKKRNVQVAWSDVVSNPKDPRAYWNLANSFYGDGQYEEARKTFEKFISLSNSDEEKYLSYINLSKLCFHLNDRAKAIEYGRMAIGIRPEYPDAYHSLGQIFYDMRKYLDAEKTILLGLTKHPPYYGIIVYNPRDYDFNPLMLLAKTYFQLARPDHALTCLESCKKIQPGNEEVQKLIDLLKKDKKIFDEALVWVEKLKKAKTKRNVKKILDKIPPEIRSYPAICSIRNSHFIKEESSGKDIVYYCGMTDFDWSPGIAKTKGIGGSEEAVINLTKEWAKLGYNVTVYAQCGNEEQEYDGVKWKPFWMFNIRDKQDLVILWRTPIPLEHEINARVWVDLHDTVPPGEFTQKRLEKAEKIFVKSKFHRSLYPEIPDDKFMVIPNGIDLSLFKGQEEKDQYLMVNTSSPDRCMDVLPALFKRVKEQAPEARLQWAYGFDIFDIMYPDGEKAEWKTKVKKEMEEAGIEDVGRLSQAECAKLYQRAHILAYPTEFAEIDCISVKKAQAVNCIPIASDFGALNESIVHGIKIHSDKTINTWSRDFKFTYGIEDKKAQDEWVKEVISTLKTPLLKSDKGWKWAEQFSWDKIAKLWMKNW